MDDSVQSLRRNIFTKRWPLDDDLTALAAKLPTHRYLENPAGQYAYIYLTHFVKALAEHQTGKPFSDLTVLDWGCGKGHVSKILQELGPKQLDSCDVLSDKEDSTFGQQTPIIERFNIKVKPLEHEYLLPYEDGIFDVVLSVGVLEHVPNDRASLGEIARILKPGGLFFCFYLPTKLSWTQKIAHWRGNDYHDRLYTKVQVQQMLGEAGLELIDLWYRQILPKNTVAYPNFRLFEKLDQLVTEYSPLRYFATNIEFVSLKPLTKI
jgi:SAM-dependent methyltransferase